MNDFRDIIYTSDHLCSSRIHRFFLFPRSRWRCVIPRWWTNRCSHYVQ